MRSRFDFVVTGLLVSVSILLPLSQVFQFWGGLQIYPFADEWLMVDPQCQQGPCALISWILEQHADHRIPLQKAIQYALLIVTGYDFRATIVVNMIVASAISILLLLSARNYRGNQSPLDILIPICIFSPMSGYTMWGFHLQFLSSVFFLSIAVFALLRPVLSGRNIVSAILALLASSLCGLNGLILATLLMPVICFIAYRQIGLTNSVRASLAITGLFITINWLSWTHAPDSTFDVGLLFALPSFISGMITASLIPFSFGQEAWKVLVIGGALLMAIVVLAFKSIRNRNSGEIALLGILLAVTALIIAVSLGRVKYQGEWQPTLAMHYGILSMLIPMLAWIAISKNLHAIPACVIGVGLVCMYSIALEQAYDWRIEYANTSSARKVEAYSAMRDVTRSSTEVIDKYIIDFWFHSPETDAVMQKKYLILQGAYKEKSPIKVF